MSIFAAFNPLLLKNNEVIPDVVVINIPYFCPPSVSLSATIGNASPVSAFLFIEIFFFKKYSPRKGLVLDAGGGPGRYTLELARLGYDVVLLDLTPELLGIAKNQIEKARTIVNVNSADANVQSATKLYEEYLANDNPMRVKEIMEEEAIRVRREQGERAADIFKTLASGEQRNLKSLEADWLKNEKEKGRKKV